MSDEIKGKMEKMSWSPFRNYSSNTEYFYYMIWAELENKKKDLRTDKEKVDSLLRDLHSSRQSFDRMYGLAKFISEKNFDEFLENGKNDDSESTKTDNRGEGKDETSESESGEFHKKIENILKNKEKKTLLEKAIDVIKGYEPEYEIDIKVKEKETSE